MMPLFWCADGDSTTGTRIESLDSTRVEDMVHEYFAKADEVGISVLLFFAYIIYHRQYFFGRIACTQCIDVDYLTQPFIPSGSINEYCYCCRCRK